MEVVDVSVLQEPRPADCAALLLPNGEFGGLSDDCFDLMAEFVLDSGTPLLPVPVLLPNGGFGRLKDWLDCAVPEEVLPGLKLFEGGEVVVLEEPTPVNDAA